MIDVAMVTKVCSTDLHTPQEGGSVRQSAEAHAVGLSSGQRRSDGVPLRLRGLQRSPQPGHLLRQLRVAAQPLRLLDRLLCGDVQETGMCVCLGVGGG